MSLDFFKNKKVLITGLTGFKGSWLAIILQELGAEVFGYSLENNDLESNYKICGLEDKVNSHYADIRDLDALEQYIKKIRPDIVFHLAAQSLVLDSLTNPLYTHQVNYMGTVNLLETLKKSTARVAVFVSTDKCYLNNEDKKAFNENDQLGGKDPYSSSKAAMEIALDSYVKTFYQEDSSCNIASARAGNVIGGGDWSANRIVPDIFRALKGNTNLILRNPDSIRPWQHVLDPLFGYIKLAEALGTKGKVFQGAWNFGPEPELEYSVKDLVETVKELEPALKYQICEDSKNLEAKTLKLSIDKAKSKLDWKPKLNFKESLEYTIQGYREENLNSRLKQIKKYINK